MHLLNTTTITLSEVLNEKVLDYAILSHRWDKTEVSFQEMQEGTGIQKPGYTKIKRCCAKAAEDGWKYVWIDSCCIDKKSSAELSEAINSMFKWYRNAQVCYAYLRDVPSTKERHDAKDSAFRNSSWFTRGWTLQELLAPENVIFFDQNWIDIGTKLSLAPLISAITGIDDLLSFQDACVAQKMSWAAGRETTRVEDIAYCLIGLFGVNMPLLYGEGENAFIRLQHEILRNDNDESLFAWRRVMMDYISPDDDYSAHFAPSPREFRLSREVRRFQFDRSRPSYSITNRGLRIEPLLIDSKLVSKMNFSINFTEDYGEECAEDPLETGENHYLMPLNCLWLRNKEQGLCIAICLRSLDAENFVRELCTGLVTFEIPLKQEIASLERRVIYLKQADQHPDRTLDYMIPVVILMRICSLPEHGIANAQPSSVLDGSPGYDYVEETADGLRFIIYPNSSSVGDIAIWFTENGSASFLVVLHLTSLCCFAGLWVVSKAQTFQDINMLSKLREPSVDRISKRLQSGKSVSVTVRKIHRPYEESYCADIIVDGEDYLPWPENLLG